MGIHLIHDLMRDCKIYRKKDLTTLKSEGIKRVGIDISGWIISGLYSKCADAGTKCVNLINKFLKHGFEVTIVFDGASPPSKSDERKKRAELRLNRPVPSDDQIEENSSDYESCRTAETEKLKLYLEKANIRYVTAAYEADHTLAYMIKNDLIDLVVTADSDLMALGCCKVLFKFGEIPGESESGDLFEWEHLLEVFASNFSPDLFLALCVAIGSDYLKGGLPQFGAKKLEQTLKALGPDFDYNLMINYIQEEWSLDVPEDFEDMFMDAFNAMKYAKVTDPRTGQVSTLTDYDAGFDEQDYPMAGNTCVGKKYAYVYNPTEPPVYDSGEQIQMPYTCWKHDCRASALVFTTFEELQIHNQVAHVYTCDVQGCTSDTIFLNKSRLSQHKTSCHPAEVKPCSHCEKVFSRQPDLERHQIAIHGIGKAVCKHCSMTFTKPNVAYIKHVASHSLPSRKCRFCSSVFVLTDDVRAHEQKEHPEEDVWFKCIKCGTKFTQKCNLNKHEKTCGLPLSLRESFTCKTCGSNFEDKYKLATHQKNPTACKAFLKKMQKKRRTQKKFRCNECGQEFPAKQNLQKHQNSKTACQKTLLRRLQKPVLETESRKSVKPYAPTKKKYLDDSESEAESSKMLDAGKHD